MALKKDIIWDLGITTNYHRVVSVNMIVNHSTIVEVKSYLSESDRQKEINGYTAIYSDTQYMEAPYNDVLGIEEAYDWLKTLDEFSGAEDV